jgi:hypothetical protein
MHRRHGHQPGLPILARRKIAALVFTNRSCFHGKGIIAADGQSRCQPARSIPARRRLSGWRVRRPALSAFRSAVRNAAHFVNFVRTAIMVKDMIAADMLMLTDISMAPSHAYADDQMRP